MEEIVAWQPLAWLFGHIHDRQKMVVGQTSVETNCRGYVGHENKADSFEMKLLEL